MPEARLVQAPLVVAFDDELPAGVEPEALLGGKGANLALMRRELALPVPPGFTITTEACQRFLASGWPDGLEQAIDAELERLAEAVGARFGDPENPLLVSVRSGAPVSMPGMMDTLLNVGMTASIRERLAVLSGNPQFAADTWLRFAKMYGEIVLGLSREEIARAARNDGSASGLLTAGERLHALARERAAPGIPDSPRAQLRGAVEAVFRSWNTDRARVFRAQEGVPDSLGTAAVVQAMVFGNLDDRSGTGVAFTRDPATGGPGPFGDYLPRAQGEDVVAGTHPVHGLQVLRETLPETYSALVDALERLERHYRDMCDVEFTVSEGRLYILQTRIGRRSPLAAVRIAVAMAEDEDFPLSRAEAVARVGAETIQKLARSGEVEPDATALTTGNAASPGVGAGVLCCDPDRAAELGARGIAFVLAREETSPADIHGMVGAAGLITSLGGVASHAAVVARSWGIPAVTGASALEVLAAGIRVGEVFVPEGETVTVDGGTGAIYQGGRVKAGSAQIPELRKLQAWAAEEEARAEPTGEEARARHERATLTLVEVARTVQLKGICSAERAAGSLAAEPLEVEQLFRANPDFFKETPRGMVLMPAGQEWLRARLTREAEALDGREMESCYERFLELNHSFKRLVSEWQRGGEAEGSDEVGWQALVEELARIHRELEPVQRLVAERVKRMQTYGGRFERALEAIAGGDRSMLASPLKDSYHTVWFEFHEELMHLCGKDRASEEARVR